MYHYEAVLRSRGQNSVYTTTARAITYFENITVTAKAPNVNNVVHIVKNFQDRDILNLLFEGFIVVARIQQEPGIKYLVAFHHFQWGPCGCGRAVQVHGQDSRLEGH